MFWILFTVFFIPSYSWAMNDEYDSAFSHSESALDDDAIIPGSECVADRSTFETPRSRSNSVYVNAVREARAHNKQPKRTRSVDGLAELEEGLDKNGAVQDTEAQMAEYFYMNLRGQELPGIGTLESEDNRSDLISFIRLIKKNNPRQYQTMLRSINCRRRSTTHTNASLIHVLTNVVNSIKDTAQVTKEYHDAAIAIMQKRLDTERDNLQLAREVNKGTIYRYRMGTLTTIAGAIVTVVLTNLAQHYLSSNDMMTQCQQMAHNATMN